MKELYPFQKEVVRETLKHIAHDRNPIIVAPTGAGKTVMIVQVVKNLLSQQKSVFFYATEPSF